MIAETATLKDAEVIASALNNHRGAVEDQRAMAQVANAVESLRAGKISAMSAWAAVVDAADRSNAGPGAVEDRDHFEKALETIFRGNEDHAWEVARKALDSRPSTNRRQ